MTSKAPLARVDMIKRLKVRNFLSLKDLDLELGRPLNVLVGPNMSGKSNLIEFFKFLRDTLAPSTDPQVPPLQRAFSARGGFHQVAWKGDAMGPISFGLEAEVPPPFKYEVVVKWNYEYRFPELDSEELMTNGARAWRLILENRSGKMNLYDPSGKTIASSGQRTNALGLQTYSLHPPFEGSRFTSYILDWQFHHLVPTLMRQSNAPAREARLVEHGQNLSSWLLTLQTHTKTFRRIKQICADVLPGLDEIIFQPVESAKISVGASEQQFATPFNIDRMSDGELVFVALISLLLAPAELTPTLICMEEPENYLHPRLIEVFVEILKQRQTEPRAPQMILTTHSLHLIDKLDIEDLIVVEKVEGSSKFTRPSTKKQFRELLSRRDLSLGDLVYSGALSES